MEVKVLFWFSDNLHFLGGSLSNYDSSLLKLSLSWLIKLIQFLFLGQGSPSGSLTLWWLIRFILCFWFKCVFLGVWSLFQATKPYVVLMLYWAFESKPSHFYDFLFLFISGNWYFLIQSFEHVYSFKINFILFYSEFLSVYRRGSRIALSCYDSLSY